MKKTIAAFFVFASFAAGAFGQTDVMFSPKDLSNFHKLFLNAGGALTRKYKDAAKEVCPADYDSIAALEGYTDSIDTPREVLYLSGATGVVNVIPAEAQSMLGTVKQGDLIRGADALKEIKISVFLGNKAREGQYRGMLKIITDRKNVTEAEIEAYYRNGIRSLVSEIVDAEAAKRSPTNPATIAEIKQIMTNFFLNPTIENHNVLYEKKRYYATHDEQRGTNASLTFTAAVNEFNTGLADSVIDPSCLANIPR
jgi:hypothetical protein